MDDYLEKGYARRLSQDEVLTSGPRKWYLPHFLVLNPNKPEKVRIVFDAAAEYENTSLNKNLLKGPDRTNSLVGELMRFRQGNIALAADIESMFHQVKVMPEDQDSLRFLWWPKTTEEPPEEFVMTVHIFGATDSPCAANSALKKTAKDNEASFSREATRTMKNNFYVDDLLKSLNTTEETIHQAKELIKLCEKGGFNLTKFVSNDREVLSSIEAKKRANPSLDLNLQKLPIERTLGQCWNLESDQLGFKVAELKKPDTMRGVLSTICTVFDPLNFAAPVMLVAKKIMQELWRKKYSWDQQLESEILQRWQCWKKNLRFLSDITVPRCYFGNPDHEGSSLELHNFSDASEAGYGSVSYLRITYPDGNVECSFVAGKSRNAPLKTVTIERFHSVPED